MMHRNAQTLGDAIREFFEDNAELRGKILEIRVIRAWGEILGRWSLSTLVIYM